MCRYYYVPQQQVQFFGVKDAIRFLKIFTPRKCTYRNFFKRFKTTEAPIERGCNMIFIEKNFDCIELLNFEIR